MNLSEKNKDGLTFIEWMCAAGYGNVFVRHITASHVQAWHTGVDPSDYRLPTLEEDEKIPSFHATGE